MLHFPALEYGEYLPVQVCQRSIAVFDPIPLILVANFLA